MTSKELIARLPIIGENILAEAAQQAVIFMDAANYNVAQMRRRSEASATLDYHRAKLALTYRARKDSFGNKPSEGRIANQLEVSPRIRRLRKAHDLSHQYESLSKLILEAFRMRRDAIRVIAESENLGLMRGEKEVEKIQERKKLINRARNLESQRSRLERDEDPE